MSRYLGATFGSLGSILGSFEAILGALEGILGGLGGLLGSSWVVLGWSWGVLGRSWGILGRSWAVLWRSHSDTWSSPIFDSFFLMNFGCQKGAKREAFGKPKWNKIAPKTRQKSRLFFADATSSVADITPNTSVHE